MATITINESFPPSTKSVLTITESSRTSEKTKFNLSVKTNLGSSISYVGTGIALYGKVEISGTGITTQSKTLTLKAKNDYWSGTAVHTTTGTFEANIPANINSIKVKYSIWYSDDTSIVKSTSITMSITKLVSQLNAFPNNNLLDIEQPLILSITKFDETYTSNLEMKVNGTSIFTLENVVDGQEINLTSQEKVDVYLLSTESNTFDIEWILKTYLDGTLLGEMTLTSKGAITNANPIFSGFDFEDIDTQVLELTGGINFVKGYSDIKISNLVAISQKYSTINYWNINNNLIENTGDNEITLENYANNTITIYVVDSRGNSTPLTKPIRNFIDYSKLTKGNQDNERIDNVTEQVNISFEGNFFECDFGNKENSLKVSYKYKKTNDVEYITGETIINPIIENNKYSFSGLIKGDTDNGFDIGNSYNIEVEVSDELSKVEYSYVIQAGIPAFAVFGNKMAIGDMYDESKSEYNVQLWNKILVNGIDFDNLLNKVGSVIITSSNENPSSIFGGEWELIDKEFDGTQVVSSKDNTYFSDTNANDFAISFIRKGHAIYTRINFYNSVALGDTQYTIGQLNLNNLGCNSLNFTKYVVGQSDGGNAVFMGLLTDSGSLAVSDVIGKTSSATIAIDSSCWIEFTHILKPSHMLDEACNKFYWKRIS